MIVWPGLRRSVSAISRLFNSATFDAPLTHSAIPTRAASGTTATFTRATTATVTNNDGYLVTALAGEARFEGARRVDNLIRLGAAQSSTLAVAANVTMTLPAGAYQFSMGAGTGRVTFSGTGGATGTLDAVTTGRVHVAKTITAGTLIVTASVATLVDIQVVSMVAETDQTTIREYVSVGVASSPYYHGSMVDGVKCFPTDLSGNPIPAATMLGYQAEGARTNLCLQSNAFTTTWAESGTLTPTQNVIGPDGATSAWTLTDNDAGVREFLYQSVTLTAATYTFSIFLKKTTGAQTSYPVIFMYPGLTSLAAVTIDTSNGVATPWTAYTGFSGVSCTATCTSFNDSFWRVAVTFTGTAAAWEIDIYPAATSNATQSTGTINVAITGSAVFYGAQVELGSFASSYIPTTTIAVTRNADVLTYSSAGNVSGTVGWCYAEATPYANNADTNNYYIADSAGASVPLYSNGVDGNAVIYDQTNAAIKGGTTFVNTPFKCASTWGGSSISVTSRGQSPASAAFDGDMGPFTSLYIGVTSGGSSLWGSIKNVRIGQRQLSASELQAITA